VRELDSKILSHLVRIGLLNETEVQATLSEQALNGERLGNVLVNNGFVTRSQIVDLLHQNLDPALLVNPVESDLVEPELLLRYRIMLLAVTSTRVYLATDSPRRYVSRQLEPFFGAREFEFRPYDPDIFEQHMAYLRHQVENRDYLDGILREAVISGVSDIHLVAKEDCYALMYRYLGVREIKRHLNYEHGQYIISQVKDRGRMDIAERRLPQDGGFRARVVDRAVDFRVATVPVVNGETAIIRILDSERVNPNLRNLGMSHASESHWLRAIAHTSGICLVCGPTGSGKSTTMNATVREMDRFGKAIYTVENPVELRLSFLNQVETNRTIGLDFARALRSFLRADPDVIIVGEIRDKETAQMAINAAETGHLVLATLHTDSPQAAVLRLENMGVERASFAGHLRGVMAQQLVRVACSACQGRGCPECSNKGFVGRTMISEAVSLSSAEEVERVVAGERWWPSLREDGERLIESGATIPAEVERVLGISLKRENSAI
jgi:general secretion pathway protein E